MTMKYSNLDLVASFMIASLRLSNYDRDFLNNLTLYVIKNNYITSNQDRLFKRVARNYQRQFNQHKLNVDDLLVLPWSCKIIPSSPEYTNASISIEDNKIILRTPYKKDFISSMRKNPVYGLEWNKEQRQYEMNFSLYTIKKVLSLCVDHFEDINFSDDITQIVERISVYDGAKYWDPTIILKNDKLYIIACTDYLYDAIKDIPFELDLKTISKLVSYGITVDDSVKEYFYNNHSREKVKFATEFITTFESSLLPVMFGWLKEFGCNTVGEFNLFTGVNPLWREGYISSLNKLQMKHVTSSEIENLQGEDVAILTSRGGAAPIANKPVKLYKFIKCVNSQPINLGPR